MVCVFAVCSIATGRGTVTVEVLTAAGRVPAGTTITSGQVRTTSVPATLVPDGAVTRLADVTGQMTAAAIARGAILTTDNFVAPAQAAAGHVIISIPVAVETLTILKPGDHVSLFLSNSATGEVVVARGVRVVTIPTSSSSGLFSSGGASVILAEVPEDIATQITSAGGLGSTTVAIE
jgi:flagella basal body P-ring formation protein FlgA